MQTSGSYDRMVTILDSSYWQECYASIDFVEGQTVLTARYRPFVYVSMYVHTHVYIYQSIYQSRVSEDILSHEVLSLCSQSGFSFG